MVGKAVQVLETEMRPKGQMRQSLQARIAIDLKVQPLQAASAQLQRPIGGWIRAIREGLGMSITDLASRAGVKPSTVHRLESSEVAGTIKLDSLKKIADDLGCDLVYGLVPRQELESTVKKRAHEVATRQLTRTQETMALEQQALDDNTFRKLVEQKALELAMSSKLWKE